MEVISFRFLGSCKELRWAELCKSSLPPCLETSEPLGTGVDTHTHTHTFRHNPQTTTSTLNLPSRVAWKATLYPVENEFEVIFNPSGLHRASYIFSFCFTCRIQEQNTRLYVICLKNQLLFPNANCLKLMSYMCVYHLMNVLLKVTLKYCLL